MNRLYTKLIFFALTLCYTVTPLFGRFGRVPNPSRIYKNLSQTIQQQAQVNKVRTTPRFTPIQPVYTPVHTMPQIPKLFLPPVQTGPNLTPNELLMGSVLGSSVIGGSVLTANSLRKNSISTTETVTETVTPSDENESDEDAIASTETEAPQEQVRSGLETTVTITAGIAAVLLTTYGIHKLYQWIFEREKKHKKRKFIRSY